MKNEKAETGEMEKIIVNSFKFVLEYYAFENQI